MSDQLPGNLKRMKLFWNDRNCALFTDNNMVFRYISAEFAEQAQTLYKSGLIDSLVRKGLLQPGTLRETDIIDYPLVIEHPFIHRLSYPFEWPALVLKEVALAILEIEEIANGYGYTLCDPGPFNVVIQNGNPVYLDYDSLVPIEETPIWTGYDGFRDFILFPLQLYGRKLHYVARSILRDIGRYDLDQSIRRLADNKFQRNLLDRMVLVISKRGEITSDNSLNKFAIACINRILNNRLLKKILEGANYMVRPAIKDNNVSGRTESTDTHQLKALGSRAEFLKRLRRKVESLEVSAGSSYWSAYYKNIIETKPPWERPTDLWTTKERNFHEIMCRLNPETALAIGTNTGWYSLMLAHNGASVISLDRDEESVNQLYSYIRKEHLDVLPLIMDIRQPTPEYELNIGTILAATKRCNSEFVMALAISNPMVSSQRVMVSNQIVKIEHLVQWLDMFTGKYLLVEFVPIDDVLAKLPSLTEENWNVQVLREAFGKYFHFEGSWDSYPQGRKLLLFRKSDSE